MLNTYSRSTQPTCLNYFWIVFCCFLHFTAPRQQLFVVVALSVSAAPHLLSWRRMSPTWTLSTPTPRQPLLLVSAPCAVCLHLPFCLVCFPPPLSPLACTQVPNSLRGFANTSLSVYLVSLFNIPCYPSLPGIFWCLVSRMGVHFCERARGQGIPTT